MLKSLLRQEVGFYDLDENNSSILSTKLETSAPMCRGLTVEKAGLYVQGISSVGFALVFSFSVNWKLAF